MHEAAVVLVVSGVALAVVGARARRRRVLRSIETSGIVPDAPTDGRDRASLEIESRSFRGPYG